MNELVVGLDGSAPSQRALVHAALQAAASGAVLRAVHAYTVPLYVRGWQRRPYDIIDSPLECAVYAAQMVDRQLADLGTARPSLVLDMTPEITEGTPGNSCWRSPGRQTCRSWPRTV